MAKKTKRKVSQVNSSSPVIEQSVTEPAESSAAQRSTFTRRSQSAVEFNPDYTYVVTDLKRIGTLAGAFFVILIVLSFFIR